MDSEEVDKILYKVGGIILCNIVAVLLYIWWDTTEPAIGFIRGGEPGLWFCLDKDIFYYFNQAIANSKLVMYITAFTNLRFFDVVPFLAMFVILFLYYRKQTPEKKKYLVSMGIVMLLSAVAIKVASTQLTDWAMNNISRSFGRDSATIYFHEVMKDEGVVFVSKLVPDWPILPKDSAGTSFPGDHGLMLIIFAFFMLKYTGFKTFIPALLVFVIFSMPRIMSGAHWFTDVAIGSVVVALVGLSWVLLTPIADWIINFINKKIPLSWIKI